MSRPCLGHSTLRLVRIILAGSSLLVHAEAQCQADTLGPRIPRTTGHFDLTALNGAPLGFAYDEAPTTVFGISGRLGIDITRSIPVLIDLSLYEHAYMNGQGNRFNISLDHRKLQQRLGAANADKIKGLLEKKDSLEERSRELQSLLSYLRTRTEERRKLDGELPPQLNLPDTALAMPSISSVPDPLLEFTPEDSVRIPEKPELPQLPSLNEEELQSSLDACNRSLAQLEERLAAERALQEGRTKGLSKLSRGLKSIKQFELGQCTPPSSPLLTSGVPIRGAMLVAESESGYFSVAHGAMVIDNAVPVTRVALSAEQLSNGLGLFQPTDPDRSGRLSTVRVGLGRMGSTHAHIGLLHGQMSGAATAPDGTSGRKNLAAELDLRWVLDPKRSLRLTYARSYSWSAVSVAEEENERSTVFDHLLKDHGNDALNISATAAFPRTATDVEVSSRWIAPFYESMGLAYVKRNSVDHDLRLAQAIGRRTSVRMMLRTLEYELVNQQGSIQHTTGTLRLIRKFGANTSVILSGTPSEQLVSNGVTDEIYRWGFMRLGTDATHRFRKARTEVIMHAGYSVVWQRGPNGTARADQYSLSGSGKLSEKVTAQVTLTRSIMLDPMDFGTTTMRTWAQGSATWTITKTVRTSAGMSMVMEDRYDQGGFADIDWKIARFMNVGIRYEKIILGDQSFSYELGGVENVNYTWTFRSTFDW